MKNKELHLAWEYISRTNTSIFLTGKAGTGKTTFLKTLRERTPKRMVVVAPTGVAAINAGGVTIHSFFQLSPGINLPDALDNKREGYYTFSKEKKNILRGLDLLVIDEISMVRADLLDAIDNRLRQYRNRLLPFGGVQLLMIGDLQQLSPVTKDDEWGQIKDYYTTPYFFSSRALQQINYVTIELQKVYRQENQNFISLLNEIRNGKANQKVIDTINQRYLPDINTKDKPGYIQLTTHKYKAQRHNDMMLESIPSRSVTFRASVDGDFPETIYPADQVLTLKVGAQVMFLKNDNSSDQLYFNGKIGCVTGFRTEEDQVIVEDEEGNSIIVGPERWDNTQYKIDEETKQITEDVKGTFMQIPLRLAWAITIHKSQGLTFDKAIIDADASFAHGQLYVALSRCRSLEGIILASLINLGSIIPDNDVNAYLNMAAQNRNEAETKLPELEKAYYRELLRELFDFQSIEMTLKYVNRILEEHLYKQQPALLNAYKQCCESFKTKITEVALKFQYQIDCIYTDNDRIQERVKKGCEYFATTLHELMFHLLEKSTIQIDNKVINKRYSDNLYLLQQSYKSAYLTLQLVKENGFDIQSYLDFKAQSILNAEDKQTKSKSKKKTQKDPKSPKEKSDVISYNLYKQHHTVEAVANIRGLTENTIINHLTGYVLNGLIPIYDFVTKEQKEDVERVINEYPNTISLSEIKSHLVEDISFELLKLILKYIRE